MKLIVAGGRSFKDYELMKVKLDLMLSRTVEPIEIVSGTAKGADQLGERYAHERGYGLRRFPANWDKYGKKAGYLRNLEMANYASHCVVFWDGKSKGTAQMIAIADYQKMPLRTFIYSASAQLDLFQATTPVTGVDLRRQEEGIRPNVSALAIQ